MQVSVAGQTGLSVFLGKSEKWRCGPTVKVSVRRGTFIIFPKQCTSCFCMLFLMLTQGVPWTVIDMAWWKGQYVVALVRLVPEDPTSPTNYCLRVHPCGNLDPSAVLASVQLPTGMTPTRVCVGSISPSIRWALRVWGTGWRLPRSPQMGNALVCMSWHCPCCLIHDDFPVKMMKVPCWEDFLSLVLLHYSLCALPIS